MKVWAYAAYWCCFAVFTAHMMLIEDDQTTRDYAPEVSLEDVADWAAFSFNIKGKAIVDSAYAHVFVNVNLTDLGLIVAEALQLRTLLQARVAHGVANTRAAADPQTNASTQPWTELRLVYDALVTDFDLVEQKYANVKAFYTSRIPNSTVPITSSRPKRFLGFVLAGLAGLIGGSAITNLFEDSKLSSLAQGVHNVEFRQKRLISLVEATDHNVQANRIKIDKIVHAVQQVDTQLQANAAKVNYALVSLYANTVLFTINAKLDSYINIVESAMAHRLSFSAITHGEAAAALAASQELAEKQGYEVLLTHPQEIFQAQASVLYDSQGFTQVIHLPLAKRETILDVWEYRGFPMRLQDAFGRQHFYQVQPDKTILAFSPKSDLYIELDTLALTLCHRINQFFICPDLSVLTRVDHPSCLMLLFLGQYEKALNRCKSTVTLNPQDMVLPLGQKSGYKIYSSNPSTYKLECTNGTIQTYPLRTFDRITVDLGCKVTTKKFMMFPASTFSVPTPIRRHYPGSVRKWSKWARLDTVNLKELLSQADNETYRTLSLEDINYIKSPYPEIETGYSWVIWLGLALVILVVLVFIVLSLRNFFNRNKTGQADGATTTVNFNTLKAQEDEPLVQQQVRHPLCPCAKAGHGPSSNDPSET